MGEPSGVRAPAGPVPGAVVWVIVVAAAGQPGRAGGLVGPFPSEVRAREHARVRRYAGARVAPMVWLVESAWVDGPSVAVPVRL